MALARLCILMGKLAEADSVLTRLTHHHPTHLTARVHMVRKGKLCGEGQVETGNDKTSV